MGKKRVSSLQGSLLLDGGLLGGSWFSRTVVLVCRHDAKGAFGLVLNRRGERKFGASVDAVVPPTLAGQLIHVGGPVQPGVLSYVFSDTALLLPNVIDHVRFSHDLEEVAELAGSWGAPPLFRVFAGYAGWSPGQLESELEQDAWIVHPSSVDLIFDPDTAGLWRRILKSRPAWQDQLLAEAPERLESN